jgi:hypothetical protein
MNKKLKLPPKRKNDLTPPTELAKKLEKLIGKDFILTGKSRTDGSNLRKLIAQTLFDNNPPREVEKEGYELLSKKGVPKILLEYVDTYIITSGTTYNLQVWNRNPSASSVQVQYIDGSTLQSNEVRFILVKIDTIQKKIETIVVLTSEYIVDNFGKFGKPTIKSQLIISSKFRQNILNSTDKILFYPDDLGDNSNFNNLDKFSIHDEPTIDSLLPMNSIKKIILKKIIGLKIPPSSTKKRGQLLENIFAKALGYKLKENESLAGGYPDIKNQALEIKLQDSPTVDLGKYSPEFEELILKCGGFTTQTMRYCIVLTNPETYIVEGAILSVGSRLGLNFTYISDKSYKSQRSIPMSFFDKFKGKSLFNP